MCGTSYGYVRVHNFPCTDNNVSICHKYPAHVNSVGDVKYSFDGSKIISCGRTDRCLVQWSVKNYSKEIVEHAEPKMNDVTADAKNKKKGVQPVATAPENNGKRI